MVVETGQTHMRKKSAYKPFAWVLNTLAVLSALLLAIPSAWAQQRIECIWKCNDLTGRPIYTSDKKDTVGRRCETVSNELVTLSDADAEAYKNRGPSAMSAEGQKALREGLRRCDAVRMAAASNVTIVAIIENAGVFTVPVEINGAITLRFVIDSGASHVAIPSDVVTTLWRTGTITNEDFLGKATYILADGSKVPSQTFRIRSMRIGNRTVHNIVGSVAPVEGSMLLGQSFFSRFKSWSIDNERKHLVIE